MRSSVSFFNVNETEKAASHWSRARTRLTKVGKGLSRDGKARQLALQNWLEAIDPRHRYGHNLSFYYEKWLHSESKQPFFYWLDVGEGKEVNIEKCPRSKLQKQCVKYLDPIIEMMDRNHICTGNWNSRSVAGSSSQVSHKHSLPEGSSTNDVVPMQDISEKSLQGTARKIFSDLLKKANLEEQHYLRSFLVWGLEIL